MVKTVTVKATITMDMEIDTELMEQDTFEEQALVNMEREIENNIFHNFLSKDDFEYEVTDIHNGSILDGTIED